MTVSNPLILCSVVQMGSTLLLNVDQSSCVLASTAGNQWGVPVSSNSIQVAHVSAAGSCHAILLVGLMAYS